MQAAALSTALAAFVNGDASQIEQVILNLCVNASHAMTIMSDNTDDWGGKLSVSVKDYMPDQAFINSHPEAEKRNYWTVSFKDSGVGGTGVYSDLFKGFYH